jgi:hypothetical protein
MTKTVHGRLHGRIIELDEDLGVPEGDEVEVEVRLVGLARAPQETRRLGSLRGTVTYMDPDFDAPLHQFKEYMP